ncbi:N-acetyltransferase [Schizosaccharomyces cryophilus OY26]|uniref:N-acetyltransferase n=1 Tax=Schizosaccharomyces cryophilus (strain OY26 / ATCC MYA-4695 / CBS 11777 / NBRC 106824 / NRRL Y48691) TaxID=653667 RepID=S9VXH3_SCHCR|nr:N-acetyltransferase [Schizosaccharomyces cryophilus OY26]EPY50879.1 N-acetyltransferase [Schizosaccharomyces cryophilus OY26]
MSEAHLVDGEALQFRNLKYADLGPVTALNLRAFQDSDTWQWRFRGVSPSGLVAITKHFGRKAYFDPHVKCKVAYTSSRPYLGFLAYEQFPHTSSQLSYYQKLMNWVNSLYERFLYWWYDAGAVKRRMQYNEVQYGTALYKTGLFNHPGGFLHVHLVAVDPEIQKRGIGKALLNIVHNDADMHRLPSFLVASTIGFGMYEHLGYRTAVTTELRDDETGEIVKISSCMIRDAKKE